MLSWTMGIFSSSQSYTDVKVNKSWNHKLLQVWKYKADKEAIKGK